MQIVLLGHSVVPTQVRVALDTIHNHHSLYILYCVWSLLVKGFQLAVVITMSLAAVILVIVVLLIIALAMKQAADGKTPLDFLAFAIVAVILILIIAFFMLLVSDTPNAISEVLKFFSYIITVAILGLLLCLCIKCMGTRQAPGNQVAIR